MLAEYQMTLSPLTDDTAEGKAGELLQNARKEMGFVPNMYANMAHSPGLLETYMTGYSAFRKGSGLSPQEQELVLLVISRDNGCEYCVAAHSTLADMSGVPKDATDAIRDESTITDPKLKALSDFTRVMVETRGNPSSHDALAFLDAGYSDAHILGIVLAISVKVISNYSNHLFHTEVDDAFAGRNWDAPTS